MLSHKNILTVSPIIQIDQAIIEKAVTEERAIIRQHKTAPKWLLDTLKGNK